MARTKSPLELAAEKAIPLLSRLGDFIANREGRCEAILALKDALDVAGKQPGPTSIGPATMARILHDDLLPANFAALWEIHERGRASELHVALGDLLADMCPKCGKLDCTHHERTEGADATRD